MRRLRAPVSCLALAVGAALTGCGSSHPSGTPPPVTPSSSPSSTLSASAPRATPASTTSTAPPTTVAPSTTIVPAIGPFRSTVEQITAADVPSTYRPGCPVGPSQLRRLRLSYWGFDDRVHTGTIVIAATVVTPVVSVFSSLYADRFPIREMRPEDAYNGHDPDSMIADNTSGFNCRNAVATGTPHWSAHAYGTAIDVNPVENPYLEGGVVQPANGSAYVDRSRVRPGMAEPDSALNRAFAAVGWQWGGRWTSAPDYQHFSANGG